MSNLDLHENCTRHIHKIGFVEARENGHDHLDLEANQRDLAVVDVVALRFLLDVSVDFTGGLLLDLSDFVVHGEHAKGLQERVQRLFGVGEFGLDGVAVLGPLRDIQLCLPDFVVDELNLDFEVALGDLFVVLRAKGQHLVALLLVHKLGEGHDGLPDELFRVGFLVEDSKVDEIVIACLAHFEAHLLVPLGVQVTVADIGLLLLAFANHADLRVGVAVGIHWTQTDSLVDFHGQLGVLVQTIFVELLSLLQFIHFALTLCDFFVAFI